MAALPTQKRDLTIDVLNILSCIAVIALHHNGLVHSYDTTRAWKESLVVECVCYWCVPVFLMISGANLMNYREKYSTGTYVKKRVLRTVIPWFLWSVIFLIWKVHTGQIVLDAPNIYKQSLEMILNNNVESVYWFFSALFACYLSIPVFSCLLENRRVLWYIVLLNFIFMSTLPIINRWIGFSWGLDIPVVGSLIIFVLLGYLLKDHVFSKKQRIILYIVGFGLMLFRYVYTYLFSIRNSSTDTSIKGFQYFHSVVYAAAVWVMAYHIPWEKLMPSWLTKNLPTISSCSLGVYMIHRFIMYYEADLLSLNDHRLLWRTVCIFLTYLVSLVIVYILKKIPLLKRIVP